MSVCVNNITAANASTPGPQQHISQGAQDGDRYCAIILVVGTTIFSHSGGADLPIATHLATAAGTWSCLGLVHQWTPPAPLAWSQLLLQTPWPQHLPASCLLMLLHQEAALSCWHRGCCRWCRQRWPWGKHWLRAAAQLTPAPPLVPTPAADVCCRQSCHPAAQTCAAGDLSTQKLRSVCCTAASTTHVTCTTLICAHAMCWRLQPSSKYQMPSSL